MSSAATTARMQLLEFDSGFFGFPIARIDASALEAGDVDGWCRERGVRCAYLLVDANDSLTTRLAADRAFRAVDIRVTLTATREPRPPRFGGVVRPAAAEDILALQTIAREAHRASRFYADGQFEWQRCNDLFAYWIERSCQDWADQVFVFDHEGDASGYVTLHRRPDKGEIGLVGVHERARGRGGASALLSGARNWFASEGCSPVTVVTQGGNRAALALYQDAGFDVTNIQIWYHRWFAVE